MAEPFCIRLTGNPKIIGIPEDGTNETFKQGDLVTLTTSGTITIGTATKVFGIAMRDATGVDASIIPVDMISPEDHYSVQGADGETAAQTMVGDERTFTFTAGAQRLSTTGTDCVVLAMDPRSLSGGAGVAGGRMIVRFEANMVDIPT